MYRYPPSDETYIIRDKTVSDLDYSDQLIQDTTYINCKIQNINLENTQFLNCFFINCTIHHVDFSRTHGLQDNSFPGSDLRGCSFPEGHFRSIDFIKDCLQRLRIAYFTSLVATIFIVITAIIPDVVLISNNKMLKLPIIEAQVSVDLFFLFAPLLLLYATVTVKGIKKLIHKNLVGLPYVFEDGTNLINRLTHWPSLTLRFPLSFCNESSWQRYLEYFISKFISFLTLGSLIFLWSKYLVCQNVFISLIHILILGICIAYHVSVDNYIRTLYKMSNHKTPGFSDGYETLLAYWRRTYIKEKTVDRKNAFLKLIKTIFQPSPLIAICTVIFLFILTLFIHHSTFPFLKHDAFRYFYADLDNSEINVRPLGWSNNNLKSLELVKLKKIQGKNFVNASMNRSFMANIEFFDGEFFNTTMQRVTLDGSKFQNFTIKKSDASHSNAYRVTINNTTIHESNFSEMVANNSSWQDVSLNQSNFSKSQLSRSKLSDVTFDDTSLKGAHLNKTNLTKVHFKNGTKLMDIDFQNATIRENSFSNLTLSNSMFGNTSLQKSSFDYVSIKNIDFNTLRLFQGNNFTNSNLRLTSFEGLSSTHNRFINSSLIDTNLSQSSWNNSIFINCDFNLSNLRNLTAVDTDFSKSKFKGSIMLNNVFTSCKFVESDFSGHFFDFISFYRCDFTNANFTNANMKEFLGWETCTFKDAVFTDARNVSKEFREFAEAQGATFSDE